MDLILVITAMLLAGLIVWKGESHAVFFAAKLGGVAFLVWFVLAMLWSFWPLLRGGR